LLSIVTTRFFSRPQWGVKSCRARRERRFSALLVSAGMEGGLSG
jgi:hypothetical protein